LGLKNERSGNNHTLALHRKFIRVAFKIVSGGLSPGFAQCRDDALFLFGFVTTDVMNFKGSTTIWKMVWARLSAS